MLNYHATFVYTHSWNSSRPQFRSQLSCSQSERISQHTQCIIFVEIVVFRSSSYLCIFRYSITNCQLCSVCCVCALLFRSTIWRCALAYNKTRCVSYIAFGRQSCVHSTHQTPYEHGTIQSVWRAFGHSICSFTHKINDHHRICARNSDNHHKHLEIPSRGKS